MGLRFLIWRLRIAGAYVPLKRVRKGFDFTSLHNTISVFNNDDFVAEMGVMQYTFNV